MNARQLARDVREREQKQQSPEKFCPDPGCLWRLSAGICPKHQDYCSGCDGVGWYEGGVRLQTLCEMCRGTGVVRRV